MIDLNDTYYISKVLNGDKAAFSYLVNRYSEMVYSISYKFLKNEVNAEDMAQEVFISAYQSLAEFRGSSKFSTWLYRITYNKAVSKLRKSTREFSVSDEKNLENWGGSEFQISGAVDDEEKVRVLEKVIRQLPDDEQLLIMLHYYEEQSIDEISVIMRISVSNVKVKLFRIRKKMKEMIKKIDKEILVRID
jgi:RNA polymerase sigma factor (sigma-70 family)